MSERAAKEHYEKIDNMINKCKDGERRFRESGTFHTVITSLAHGAEPINIIDQLVEKIDENQEAMRLMIESGRYKAQRIVIEFPDLEQLVKYEITGCTFIWFLPPFRWFASRFMVRRAKRKLKRFKEFVKLEYTNK